MGKRGIWLRKAGHIRERRLDVPQTGTIYQNRQALGNIFLTIYSMVS